MLSAKMSGLLHCTHTGASFLLNLLLLLSSTKDQGPMAPNRYFWIDCRTRDYSEIGAAA